MIRDFGKSNKLWVFVQNKFFSIWSSGLPRSKLKQYICCTYYHLSLKKKTLKNGIIERIHFQSFVKTTAIFLFFNMLLFFSNQLENHEFSRGMNKEIRKLLFSFGKDWIKNNCSHFLRIFMLFSNDCKN